MKAPVIFALVLGAFSIAIAGCSSGPSTSYSEAVEQGDGTIRSYVTMGEAEGQSEMPLAIGIEMSASSLDGLPSQMSESIVHLPEEASANSPFKWVMVDWNPEGHIPPGVYDVPHFDFHFYMTEEADLLQIKAGACEAGGEGVDCETFQRATMPLAAEFAPHGHVDVGAVVPGMGNHLINPTGPEFSGAPFTHTFIYGTFDGQVTFYEPMITTAFLEGRPENLCVDINQPERFATPGNYPTKYCVRYDQERDVYTVSLEEFVTAQ